MKYRIIKPKSSVSSVIKHFYVIEILEEDLPLNQRLIPFGWFELFFYLNSTQVSWNQNEQTYQSGQGLLTGHLSQAMNLCFKTPAKIFGICLQPWAGNFFLNEAANLYANSMTPININTLNCQLDSSLTNAINQDKLQSLIEDNIVSRLANYTIDTVVRNIIETIIDDSFSFESHKKYLKQVGLTQKRIEQRFLEVCGTTISGFVKQSRLDHVLRLLDSNEQSTMTQVGLYAGYYDQPHFNHEVKKFTAMTPKILKNDIQQMTVDQRNLFIN